MSTNDFKAKQINEAIERMRMCGLMSRVIGDFKNGRKLYLSEQDGYLRWLEDGELEKVKRYEMSNGNVVYHVLKTETNGFGAMLTFLYVSKYEEEWEADRNDIKNHMAVAYVENETWPERSEAGTIGFTLRAGGLSRTF